MKKLITRLYYTLGLLLILQSLCIAQADYKAILSESYSAMDSLKKLPQTAAGDSVLMILHSIILENEFLSQKTTEDVNDRLKPLRDFYATSIHSQKDAYFCYINGFQYLLAGLNDLALENFNKSLLEFKKHGNKTMEARAYSQLGSIVSLTLINDPSYDSETRKSFFKYTNEAILKNQSNEDPFLLSQYYLNIALGHLINRAYEESREYYKKSWEVVKDTPEKYWYQYYNGKWAEGLCLIHLGQNKQGFELINLAKKAISVSQKPESENLRAVIGYLLGEYYIEQKNYKQALIETNNGASKNPGLKIPFLNHFYNKNYYRIYKAQGDFAKALDYHEQITSFNTQLEKAETRGNYIRWANLEENVAKDQQIKELEVSNLNQSNDRQKMIRNFLILAFLALGALVIYILQNNKQLKTANENLIQKNKEIESALFKGQHLERKRVASELHDTLATKVSALKWRMEAINETLEIDKEPFENVVKSLEELYTDIRFISHNLLPEELEKEGLNKTLSELMVKLNRLNKTNFKLVVDGLVTPLNQMVQYEFYNVILELCNNILKHAEASNAFISISEIDKRLYLTVTDDGKGINQKKKAKGIGLNNIKNRIDSISGEMNVESDENGTKVTVVI